MPIFKAIGLGVFILILQFLVPALFEELEATVIAFLHGARISAEAASSLAASAGSTYPHSVPPSVPLHNP